jgi:hypothetical protein
VRRVYSGEHVAVSDKGDWSIDALSGWKA